MQETEQVPVCECGDWKDQHEDGHGPSKLLPALGEPRCKKYRFHHKEERKVFRNTINGRNESFLPAVAKTVNPCPLCGSPQLVGGNDSFYHSGTCSMANHSLPSAIWNGFYCWKKLDEARTNAFEDENEFKVELAAKNKLIASMASELCNLISQLEAIQQINDVDLDGAKKVLETHRKT